MSEGTESSVQPLNEGAASALAAYGAHAGLSPDAKTALRARISASVAAEAAPSVQATPAIDVRRSFVRISVALAAAAAVLLAIRFVALDGDGAVRRGAEDAPQAAYGAQHDDAGGQASARTPVADDVDTARDDEPPPTPVPEATDLPEPAPLEALDADARPNPTAVPDDVTPTPASERPRRKPAVSPEDPALEPEPVDTTLAAELELMRSARAALRRGDPDGALRTLTRHATEFADGQLLEDRKALRVQALCDAGRDDEARAAAQAFANAHPGSLHVGRVKKICENT